MSTWVVPGAPLPGGRGWRLWYALPRADTAPGSVQVSTDAGTEAISCVDRRLPALDGFERRIVVRDVLLDTPVAGRRYRIHIPEAPGVHRWSTMPERVGSEGVSFLFGSCFWENDDREGSFHSATRAILGTSRPQPDFRLLIGDQIYLDYPIPWRLWQSKGELVGAVYDRYWRNEPYRQALCALPNFFVCDDHEFWNDYPEYQRHLPHTYGSAQREAYGAAALSYYDAFQAQLNPDAQRWYRIELDPASIFVTDTRSERTPIADPAPCFMDRQRQWPALEAWFAELRGPGILVLGQPLLQKDGDWKDHSLSNFVDDYRRLLGLIEAAHRGETGDGRPHDILVLSGDIHTGRHASALPGTGREVHEYIASASSRIGPFLSTPEPELPPGTLPSFERRPPGRRWQVRKPHYTTIDNNLGLIALHPSTREGKRVRVDFVSYRVRYPRRASWRFWEKQRTIDWSHGRAPRLYRHELHLA